MNTKQQQQNFSQPRAELLLHPQLVEFRKSINSKEQQATSVKEIVHKDYPTSKS